MNTSALITILAFGLCATLVQCQNLVELRVKTADAEGASMDLFGNVNIEMINIEGDYCNITNLGNWLGNDFEQGALDIFSGWALGSCDDFPVPENKLELFSVSHSGFDAWQPEFFRMTFDDSTELKCTDGEILDDYDVHELQDNCQ